MELLMRCDVMQKFRRKLLMRWFIASNLIEMVDVIDLGNNNLVK